MRKSFIATFWSLFDRIGTQAFSFVIGIVLARLLSPTDYGIIGLSMIFISFSNVFMECGFSNALIRKLDVSDIDYSTAFYVNLIMGLVIYGLIWIVSPYAASYFETPLLVPILRIVGLNVFLNSLCVVQNAILLTQLQLKNLTIINLCGLVPSGCLAIVLAFKGFGVYSLAIQAVFGSVIRTILLWIITHWAPIRAFNRQSMCYLWNFGSKLIIANIIGVMFNKIYTFIIGKYIGKTDLGYYSKAESLASQPDSIISGVIQKVAVPLFSQYQNDKSTMLLKYKRCIKLVSMISYYSSSVLITVAYPLVIILWGTKWADTIIMFQLLLFSLSVSAVSGLNLQLLSILNQTGYTLKLEFIKKPLYVLYILLAVNWGILGLLISHIFVNITAVLVNMKASKKFLAYSYQEQIIDTFKYAVFMLISISVLYPLQHLSNLYLWLILGIFFSSAIYLLLLMITRDAIFLSYCKAFLRANILKYKY